MNVVYDDLTSASRRTSWRLLVSAPTMPGTRVPRVSDQPRSSVFSRTVRCSLFLLVVVRSHVPSPTVAVAPTRARLRSRRVCSPAWAHSSLHSRRRRLRPPPSVHDRPFTKPGPALSPAFGFHVDPLPLTWVDPSSPKPRSLIFLWSDPLDPKSTDLNQKLLFDS